MLDHHHRHWPSGDFGLAAGHDAGHPLARLTVIRLQCVRANQQQPVTVQPHHCSARTAGDAPNALDHIQTAIIIVQLLEYLGSVAVGRRPEAERDPGNRGQSSARP